MACCGDPSGGLGVSPGDELTWQPEGRQRLCSGHRAWGVRGFSALLLAWDGLRLAAWGLPGGFRHAGTHAAHTAVTRPAGDTRCRGLDSLTLGHKRKLTQHPQKGSSFPARCLHVRWEQQTGLCCFHDGAALLRPPAESAGFPRRTHPGPRGHGHADCPSALGVVLG